MPFELHEASTTFQRLMNKVLQCHDQYAVAYIDDVVYNGSREEHLWHLTHVFKALRDVGLTVNLATCHLRQKEVTYLGYVVWGGKLRLLVNQVQPLADTPMPKTKKKVHQFLGLAGYYQRFISDFATIAGPPFRSDKEIQAPASAMD